MTLATSRQELERWLAGAAFNAYYQFRLREIGAGECTIDVPFRVEFERPGGTVSGPVFMAAADVAIWFAVATRLGSKKAWVTVDLKTAFLRAARREPFTCTAHVLKIGRRLVYAVAECVGGDGTLLTHHTALYAPVPAGQRAAARRRGRPARTSSR
jgi:uncharacterized protein (TIGR00369 family)